MEQVIENAGSSNYPLACPGAKPSTDVEVLTEGNEAEEQTGMSVSPCLALPAHDRPNKLVPGSDFEEFCRLPDAVRSEFRVITLYVERILGADSVTGACKLVAPSIGMSWNTLYQRVMRFKKSGDWRELINRAKAGPAFWAMTKLSGVPQCFVEYYRGLCERNNRVDMGGWRLLIQIWETHMDVDAEGKPVRVERIPGYRQWPRATAATGYPAGWTYQNLQRKAKHDAYDKLAARVSGFAASAFRPPVLTTRVGLALMEFVEVDDHEYNCKIRKVGQSRVMRPRGFNAVDVLSGCIFAQSFKPTLWDLENEVKKALTEKDMMWFVIHILCDIGYRADEKGTMIAAEYGTAAIREAFAGRILQVTGDKVKVINGGLFGKAMHPGQFDGRRKGNFKHKPHVEESFSLVDNYFAELVGQTGLDRNTFPDDTAGREKYFAYLMRKCKSMTEGQIKQLVWPFMTWHEFLHKALDFYKGINACHDHELEGWEACGHVRLEWRPTEASPWMPQAMLKALPAADQQSLMRVLGQGEDGQGLILTRAQRMSRGEVFDAHASELTRVPPSLFPELMGLDAGRELVVTKDHLFVFEDYDISTEPLMFLAATRQQQFRIGEKFLCFVNPFNPSLLVACKAGGQVVGLCEMWERPCKNDLAGIRRMVGKQSHWEADRKQALALRHGNAADARARMLAHNEAVMGRPAPESLPPVPVDEVDMAVFDLDGDGEEVSPQNTQNDAEGEEQTGMSVSPSNRFSGASDDGSEAVKRQMEMLEGDF
jgi:hypothetical protein